ncbi:MAG: SH3 domain-containing protein [Lachnospiraceae bacterium]
MGGQTVTKTGEDGDWIKIEFEGQTGYVRGDMFQ